MEKEYNLIDKTIMFKNWGLGFKYAVVETISYIEDWYDENYIFGIKPNKLRKQIITENISLFENLDEAKKCYKVKKGLPQKYLNVNIYKRLNDSDKGIMI